MFPEVQQLLQMLDPGMVESAERLLGAVLCNLTPGSEAFAVLGALFK